MKKVILVILLIVVLVVGYLYSDNTNEDKPNKPIIDNTDEVDVCSILDGCVIVDNIRYDLKKETRLTITDMYNYDNSHMEAGYLNINEEKKLEFLSLDEKVVKTFDNISNVKYFASTDSKCSDQFYVVLTEDGKLYRNDLGGSLFIEAPFYEIEGANNISDVLLINIEDDDGNCYDSSIIGFSACGSYENFNKVD